MSAKTALGVVTKCPGCGASLEATPDTVVYICRYCGWAGVPEGQALELEGVEATEIEEVKRKVKEFIHSEAGPRAVVKEEKSLLLPFWVVVLNVSTKYNGYRTQTRTRQSLEGTSDYTVYVPVKGVLQEAKTVPLYARTFESFFGLGEVKTKVQSPRSPVVKLDIVKATKEFIVLGPEMSEEQAVGSAETVAADAHRGRAEDMTSKLYDCYTTAQVLSKRLLLFPVLEVKYELDGKIYMICADASKQADARVLKAEMPVARKTRFGVAIATTLAILLVAIAAAAANFLVPLGLQSGEGGILVALLAIAGPPALAAFIGWKGVMRATTEEIVWKSC
jgi:hypothetical protein